MAIFQNQPETFYVHPRRTPPTCNDHLTNQHNCRMTGRKAKRKEAEEGRKEAGIGKKMTKMTPQKESILPQRR